MHVKHPSKGRPLGSLSFGNVSKNATRESKYFNPSLEEEEEGVYDSGQFSENVQIDVITRIISKLKKADLYESANEMYKLLIPIFEKNRDYTSLEKCHFDLKHIFNKIIATNANESRMFGTYFRVGFFGLDFGELNQTEWIYKERKLAKLRDVQDRLKEQFNTKCKGNIEIYQKTGKFDVENMDGEMNYIQLTSVKPYWPKEEDSERITYFERNSRIDQFVFEAPFTKIEGKNQAEHVKDQWKKVYILKTGSQFPYIKTRIPVVSTEILELSPLETSIGDIEKRVIAIEEEISKKPLNPKTLQPVLQGVVKLMVNKGPKEIVETFLINEEQIKFPQHQIQKLSQAFANLIQKCEQGLAEDRLLTRGTELEAFHNALEDGLEETKQLIVPHLKFFSNKKKTRPYTMIEN
eukprot:TRINITY_DN3098_c0_g1_i2.p1 TRINITY_DN3098_c0_g1~~TRINITY_DN3098_c0_g1_i2.p1  ORF type:complete len:408 (-),score=125.32 TRINITY_DN3098_c0_g1_i2:91-1314(-)